MGVRTRTRKYVRFERGRQPWLFDLEKDPQELQNPGSAKRWRNAGGGGNSTGVGRNHPCPCGSGLKYKKCCGTV